MPLWQTAFNRLTFFTVVFGAFGGLSIPVGILYHATVFKTHNVLVVLFVVQLNYLFLCHKKITSAFLIYYARRLF